MGNLGSILLHAERGRIKKPELAPHIEGAVRIIRKDLLTRIDETNFLCKSEQKDGPVYHVNGKCQCVSFTGELPNGGRATVVAPDGWCKHRLAMALVIKDETWHNTLAAEIDHANRRIALAEEAEDRAIGERKEAYAARAVLLDYLMAELSAGAQEEYLNATT